ncbi:MAG: ATP-binding cassette domain-containing protein [bacterium]|nr:ATP-binding cassette domain-containing protein [bacterium]
MKTYLRMLRMVRPYTGQLVMAVIAMFIFSAASVFSTAMLSPFLETLFLKGDEPAAATAPAPEQAPTLTVTDGTTNAITGDSGPRAETDAERAARYNALRGQVSWVDEIKLEFKAWAATHLLQGTKQQALLRICLTFFFFTLLKNIACYLQEILMAYVGHAVIRDLRGQLYRKFTDLPLAFYHRHKAGELISRATNDVLVAQQCVGASFMKLVKEPIYIVMFLTVALIISWQMTLLAFALMPASLAVVLGISRTLRRISHRQQEQMADLTSTLQETVYGIRVIKAFAMEKFETAKFTRQAQELFKQVFRFDYTMKASSPLTEQLSMAVGLFLLWFGGSRVFTGGLMAPDMFIFFLFAIFSMVRPLKNVGQVGAELQAGLAAAERIFAVLDEPTETATLAGTRDLGRSRGEVELQDVHFSYLPGEPVLRGVSLKVGAGQVVALAGSSGAGKSTLMDMIPGFYTPQQGRVLVDGHRRARTGPAVAAPQHGHRHAGSDPVPRHGAAQHRLRPGQRAAGEGARGRPRRQRRRVHHEAAPRLRHDHRRPRRHALGRAAPAPVHRAGHPQGPGHPPARRGHQRPRHRVREAGPGSHRPPGAQPHHHRHRPSPVDDPRRRPHLPARTGPGGAGRHARRAAGGRWPLQGAVRPAVQELAAGGSLPMNQFAYVLRPSRPKMLTEGPTENEARLVGEHFAYLQGLLAAGSLRLAGRVLDSGERTFGIVIFEAVDSAAAAALMAADPAVKGGVMGAELFPFNIALMAGGAGVEG